MEEGFTGGVRIVSRRLVRPKLTTSSVDNNSAPPKAEEDEIMHLTPWDLRMITVDYIQKGLLLPKPSAAGGAHAHRLVDGLASSFARALARFYPLAGRLAVDAATGGPGVVVSLRCSGEGAEFVHAEAPDVTVSDIITPPAGRYYVPSALVWSLFPLNGLLGTDAALDDDSRAPLLSAQVTELADGVFVAMSLNHAVGDGTTFWHLFNTWSEISRAGGEGREAELSTPRPVLDRWFLDTCPVPIALPLRKLEDIVRQPEYPPVRECFFDFPAESVRKLKAKANAEMAAGGGTAPAAVVLSSLQSLLAHLWRAVCRARELAPGAETAYLLLVGCRARVRGVPQAYVGNAVTLAVAKSTAGEVLGGGLGWAALLLNRAVASFDEAGVRAELAAWARDPRFAYVEPRGYGGAATVATGSSPRFDVYGNDFGWGRPMGVRSGAGNKMDGKVTVYEGRGGAGSMALEVCLEPQALARLVADDEFMEAVSAAAP